MKPIMAAVALALLSAVPAGCGSADRATTSSDQVASLASWNDTATRRKIIAFVESATDAKSPNFIREEERIAVFDNDGTLWSEKPFYFQFAFAVDRAKKLAAQDPGWASTPALKAAAQGDMAAITAGGTPWLLEIVAATHEGLDSDQFASAVAQWLATARNGATGRRYRDMTYAPMVELLDYLRANGFKVYIASGGGLDFMRVFAEDAYGIPPENVIGSIGEATYEVRDGAPRIIKGKGIALIDDGPAKPLSIMRHIGRRPVFIGGNSDGDFEMAEWATSAGRPALALFVHHTDAKREFAYDRESAVGKLDKALTQAPERGWLVVDMVSDWKRVWQEAER